MPRTINTKTVSGTYLFLLIFSPLAFGSVELWSMAVLETASVLAFALYFLIRNRRNGPWREVPGLVPLLLLLSVMALQIVPLPGFLLSVISPNSFEVYGNTIGIVDENFWAPISIDRRATLFEFMRYLSYTAFYVTGVQLMSDKGRLRFFARAVVLAAASIAFISIMSKFTSSELILWVREAPAESKIFGPYVNKNHFAAYMGMVFPISMGLFLIYRPSVSRLSIIEALKAAAGYKRIHKHLMFGFASLLIASSVLVSLSRGGIMALCGSMVLMAALLSRKKASRSMAMGMMFILVAVFVGWFGWDPIVERFGAIIESDSLLQVNRSVTWQDAVEVIKDFPLLGAGFGSFGSVYPAYRTFPGRLVTDHAHNDYIELLTDGGLVSFALVIIFIGSVVIRVLRALWARREPYSVTMGIAGLTSIVYMLMHALVDFNMHIGANGLYFFFALAFAVSASHTRLREGSRKSMLEKVQLRKKGLSFLIVCIVSALIALANVAAIAASMMQGSYLLASRLDPLNSEYALARARESQAAGVSSLDSHIKAVKFRPTDSRALYGLALSLDREGNGDGARELMRASLRYGARHHDNYINYASWLIGKGMYIDAEEVVREGIKEEPRQTVRYARVLARKGLSGPEILSTLPPMAGPHVALAGYFSKNGNALLADDTYWRALDLMLEGESLSARGYAIMFHHFSGRKRFDAALAIAKGAVADYPDMDTFRAKLALAYERLGRREEALAEYKKALSMNPGNKWALDKMAKLTGERR